MFSLFLASIFKRISLSNDSLGQLEIITLHLLMLRDRSASPGNQQDPQAMCQHTHCHPWKNKNNNAGCQ